VSTHVNPGHEASNEVVPAGHAVPDRFENPGHPEHHDRRSDLDPGEIQTAVINRRA